MVGKKPYGGYLAPFADLIEGMDRQGQTPKEIAQALFDAGVRSPNQERAFAFGQDIDHVRTFVGLIRHMLGKNKSSRIAHLRRRISRLEAELEAARAQAQKLSANNE